MNHLEALAEPIVLIDGTRLAPEEARSLMAIRVQQRLSDPTQCELVFSDADSGYGFTGIAVALLGRLNPLGVVLAALFFALLRACFVVLEIEVRVPSVTGMALQGLVIVLMLVLTQPTMMAKLRRK